MTGATEELLRISEEFLRAIASRSSEALDTILDEGFIHLQSGGERLTRDEFVSNIADAPYTVEEIDFESIRVEVQENVAVAAGIQRAQVRLPDGETLVSRGSFTDVFQKKNGSWKLWLAHLHNVDCDLRSIPEIQGAIRERAGKTPAGEWVLGFKYDDTKTAEKRPLTRDDLRADQDARDTGDLGLRIYCLIGYTHLAQMLKAGVRTGLGDEWVKVGPMKATCDGSISEQTARLSEPFVGRPNDYGILVMEEAELYEYARKAHEAGWQIGIHANGDVAIDITLWIYERLQREMPRRDPRFRLEHCTVINDSLISRIRALGAIPNPFSTYVYYHGEKMVHYGAERLNSMFAVRSFLDAGIKVTQTSDYPPGPFEPMMALQSSVTRTDMNGNVWGPRQRVTVEEAIRVGTLHGAYASYQEQDKGSIESGKLADLVVLGQDPTRVEPSSLIDIPIERTMVGGRWVFEA